MIIFFARDFAAFQRFWARLRWLGVVWVTSTPGCDLLRACLVPAPRLLHAWPKPTEMTADMGERSRLG